MARVKKDSLFNALSGHIGREIIFKHYRDKTVVSKYPDMDGIQPSEKQNLQRQKMREALEYWMKVKRDPKLRAVYEKGLIEGQRLYNKVIGEFMRKSDTQRR